MRMRDVVLYPSGLREKGSTEIYVLDHPSYSHMRCPKPRSANSGRDKKTGTSGEKTPHGQPGSDPVSQKVRS